MGFGPAWRVQGSEIIPLGSVDTIRIPGSGENSTITRDADQLEIASSASGTATLDLNTGGTSGCLRTGSANRTRKLRWNSTGIGVFNDVPVAQQSKQADLNVGVSGLEDTQTFCNTLQERLAIYGWLA